MIIINIVLTSDYGQVHIVINSCISVLYLECWYIFVLVFDYCHKDVEQCFNLQFTYILDCYAWCDVTYKV